MNKIKENWMSSSEEGKVIEELLKTFCNPFIISLSQIQQLSSFINLNNRSTGKPGLVCYNDFCSDNHQSILDNFTK